MEFAKKKGHPERCPERKQFMSLRQAITHKIYGGYWVVIPAWIVFAFSRILS
jgi:hypothetical protein